MDDIKPVAWLITGDGQFGVKDGIVEMHKEGLLYWENRGYDTVPLYPESALSQAREEGLREGMREAAEICNDNPWLNGVDCAEIITRASEGK